MVFCITLGGVEYDFANHTPFFLFLFLNLNMVAPTQLILITPSTSAPAERGAPYWPSSNRYK